MKRYIRCQIPKDRAGAVLLDFLCARFPYHDRAGWAAEIEAGRMDVNGRPASADRPLAFRDTLEYRAPDLTEPAVNRDVTVVYEDADLLVVNKPAHLPCHPGGRYFAHTLWAILKSDFGIAEPAFINRLDRETSGLVVVSRSKSLERSLRALFAGRRVFKQYVAIVEGTFPVEQVAGGVIVDDTGSPIRKRRRFLPGVAEQEGVRGTWAETRFRCRSTADGMSVVEAEPLTGRLHQIRVTLCALGFPIVGDKLYGVDPLAFLRFCTGTLDADDRRRLRLDRQALHAAVLEFRHPRHGTALRLEAPLPGDLAEFMREHGLC